MRNTLPVVIGLAVTLLCFGQAEAMPLSPQGLAASSDVQTVAYVRGRHGGAAVRGPRGGAAVRGPRGNVAVRGSYRVGGRYYGGVWYGHGRRWYGGRWWAYGVGRCWTWSPIGYVWVCG